MEYMTVSEAAEKWGVTVRRVQMLCNEGRIKGAVRFGPVWKIPVTAVLPKARKKNEVPHLPMPRKSPFLDMTNLYNRPGCADECAEMLVNNPEAYTLFKAQLAYRRGAIDEVYDHARYFLSSRSGFYAILGGGMLLALCAIWRGDINLWYEAKSHICEAPCESEEERDMISLSLAIIDSTVYDNKDYPEWFQIGNFEMLPGDSHPAAKVYYIKYIYMTAFALATDQQSIEGMQGLSLMRFLPNTVEPLISQAVLDGTVIPEIFLRLSCAVAYHNSGEEERAIAHMDKAIRLALADGLYGILTEYVRHFDGVLEERIALLDADACEIVQLLYAKYKIGWSTLSGKIRNKLIAVNLTRREHECAKLVAFGFKPSKIAKMLHISESSVVQAIQRVYSKTGIVDKKDIPQIL